MTFSVEKLSFSYPSRFAFAMTYKDAETLLLGAWQNNVVSYQYAHNSSSNWQPSTDKQGMGPVMVYHDNHFIEVSQKGSHDTDKSSLSYAAFTPSSISSSKPNPKNIKTDSYNPETDQPVGMAEFGGNIYIAFKRGGHALSLAWYDNQGHWSTFDDKGLLNPIVNSDKKDKDKKYKVPYNGGGDEGYIITSAQPALAAWSDNLYLAFRINGGNHGIWFGHSKTPSSHQVNSWGNNFSPIGTIENVLVRTKSAFDMCQFKQKIVLAYANDKEDNKIYICEYSKEQGWHNNYPLPDPDDTAKNLKMENNKSDANLRLLADPTGTKILMSFSTNGNARLYALS